MESLQVPDEQDYRGIRTAALVTTILLVSDNHASGAPALAQVSYVVPQNLGHASHWKLQLPNAQAFFTGCAMIMSIVRTRLALGEQRGEFHGMPHPGTLLVQMRLIGNASARNDWHGSVPYKLVPSLEVAM